MRARFHLVCAALFGLVGCQTATDGAAGVSTPNPGGGGAPAECVTATDCTAAGPSCCVCPTYAVPVSSGWDNSCEDVTCDIPADCPTEPACEGGLCVLVCTPVACDGAVQCDGGFARDDAGCLSCSCAPSDPQAPAECTANADCVEVPADCCGCARGGADTAVPASEAGAFADSLGCTGSGSCPERDVCDPAASARCVAGACLLVSSPGGGGSPPDAGPTSSPQACGGPDLAPCPVGQACVVNDPGAPAGSNLGICRPE